MTLCWALLKNDLLSLRYNKHFHSCEVGIVTCMHTCCTWLLHYATPTHLPSICPFTRPYVLISALSVYLPPVLWAWIRAPATHFLGARIITTSTTFTPPAAFSALPQHLPYPFSVIVLSSQYLYKSDNGISNEEAVNEHLARTSGARIRHGSCGKSQVTWGLVGNLFAFTTYNWSVMTKPREERQKNKW